MQRPFPGRGSRQRPLRTIAFVCAVALSLLYAEVRPSYGGVAVGGSTGGFLNFEVGGRPSGMAGAQVSSAEGVMAQFWNPAGLYSLDRPQVGGMHASWLDNLSYEWLGYAAPMNPKLGVGSLSVAYFHMPSIQGMDDLGNPTSEFRVYDMAVTAGLARPMGRHFALGANAKMIRQNLATVSATGFAADLGASAFAGGATFSLVAQNLGPSLSYDGSSYPLSRQIRFGASREWLSGKLLLGADYNMPSDYYDDARIGAELRAHPNVALRMGYRHEFGEVSDPAEGFSYGLGLHFGQLNVDYALTPDNDFSNVHRLSFGYSFGSGAKEVEPKQPKHEEPKPEPPAPTGPKVIAQAPETKAAPTAPAKPSPAPQAAPKTETVAAAPAPKAAEAAPTQTAAPAAAPTTVAVAKAPEAKAEAKPDAGAAKPDAGAAKPAPAADTQYVVVLPGYPSKESAQAEMKALELLGFRTKDAQIAKDPKHGGYRIAFTKLKNKGNAEEVASDLQRMSFRALVEVAQK